MIKLLFLMSVIRMSWAINLWQESICLPFFCQLSRPVSDYTTTPCARSDYMINVIFLGKTHSFRDAFRVEELADYLIAVYHRFLAGSLSPASFTAWVKGST